MNIKLKKQIIETRNGIKTVHDNIISGFREKESTLPDKKKLLVSLKKEHSDLFEKGFQKRTKQESDRYNALYNEIESLQKDIIAIENNTYEIDYYLTNAKLLMSYFSDNYSNKTTKIINHGLFSTIKETDGRNDTIETYMKNVGLFENISEKKVSTMSSYVCSSCEGDTTVIDGFNVCLDCGLSKRDIDNIKDFVAYKDFDKIVQKQNFPYNRSSHFKEWLNNIQGKSNIKVPDELYTKLYAIFKTRSQNISKLTPDILRKDLKSLNENKYYEHIPYILHKISGKVTVKFTPEQESDFIMMFSMIQEPFNKHKPSNRKNFLSYSYIISKFCELKDLDHYLVYFKDLKDRQKKRDHNTIWEKICRELNWQFIESD